MNVHINPKQNANRRYTIMADNNKNWEDASSIADLLKLTDGAKEAEKMIRTVTHTRKRDKFQHALITTAAAGSTILAGIMIYEYFNGSSHGCNGTNGEVNSAF